MKRLVSTGLLIAFLAGCAPYQPSSMVTSPRTYEGAAAGGLLGAAAGALIDKENRWRGALIGGALGAALGGTITEISARAAREAAMYNRTVVYTSQDGFQKVEARPMEAVSDDQGRTKCRKVRVRKWQGGKLVQEEIQEICEAEGEPITGGP